MKSILQFLFLAAVVTMAGCSSLNSEQIASCHTSGVSSPADARIQNRGKLGVADIVELSQCGVRSSQIITYLAYSQSDFTLSPEDVQNLREEGVSGDVITYLREQPNKTGGLLSTF